MSDVRSRTSASALEEIHALYIDLARNPGKDFGWGKGNENARALRYDARWVDSLLDRVWESAAAVGDPFCLGPIPSCETVVNLGCGAGANLCIAAMLVGTSGRAIGIMKRMLIGTALAASLVAALSGYGRQAVAQAMQVMNTTDRRFQLGEEA